MYFFQEATGKTVEAFSVPGLSQRGDIALSYALGVLPCDRLEGAPNPIPGAYQVLAQLDPK